MDGSKGKEKKEIPREVTAISLCACMYHTNESILKVLSSALGEWRRCGGVLAVKGPPSGFCLPLTSRMDSNSLLNFSGPQDLHL